jgi:hypothetical protein
MRRTASEVLRSLEMRVARLERQASDKDEYDALLSLLVRELDEDEETIEEDLQAEIDGVIDEERIDGGAVSILNLKRQGSNVTFTIKTSKGSANVAMSLKGSYFDASVVSVVKKASMNFDVTQSDVVNEAIQNGLDLKEAWSDREGVRLVVEGVRVPSMALKVTDSHIILEGVVGGGGRSQFDKFSALPLQTGPALNNFINLMKKKR